jgi:hypothetical protein
MLLQGYYLSDSSSWCYLIICCLLIYFSFLMENETYSSFKSAHWHTLTGQEQI